ncbi:ATP-binding protein [Bifidobacterium aesculapii]|uniref:ATP-binding protein n=1 Tax=Bifidobacterium aesculapii TaxID=1329411 RepID=UPI000B2F0B73|nr:ATP-binding protein [Bifidobacterium aesculapii]
MLTVFGDKARARKWDVIEETASEGLCERLVNELRSKDHMLDRLSIKPAVSFAGTSVSLGEAELSPKRMPETMRQAMSARLDALAKHHAGLLITIDETQAAQRSDMIALATAIQHQVRERRDIAIAFAGLPQMISDLFNNEVIAFLRRAKTNVLTDVPINDVQDAFSTTFRSAGMEIDDEQLRIAAEATRGYPYIIQLVGYHIWDAADMRDSDIVTDGDITDGLAEARIDLDNAVCVPELHGLSRNDRAYLEAMATSDGPRLHQRHRPAHGQNQQLRRDIPQTPARRLCHPRDRTRRSRFRRTVPA